VISPTYKDFLGYITSDDVKVKLSTMKNSYRIRNQHASSFNNLKMITCCMEKVMMRNRTRVLDLTFPCASPKIEPMMLCGPAV